MLGGEGEYRPQTIYRVQSRRSLDFPFKRVCIFMASSISAVVDCCGICFGFNKPNWAKYCQTVSDPSKPEPIQPHASIPTHALTPDKDCDKLADGKQTNRGFIGQVRNSLSAWVFYKEETMELFKVLFWALLGVFTYLAFEWSLRLLELLWKTYVDVVVMSTH